MEQYAVSVIISIYNTAPYLPECLNSIVNQSLRNIEILCVDRGSTDDSPSILQYYAERDCRISVLHQDTHHCGLARSCGLEQARGEYIYFIDSDDVLLPDGLLTLYSAARDNLLDIVSMNGEAFGGRNVDPEIVARCDKDYHRHGYDGIYSGPEMLKAMYSRGDYQSSPWFLLIKRELLLNNILSVPENRTDGDTVLTLQCMLSAKKMMHIDKAFFLRRLHPGSDIMQKNSIQKSISFGRAYHYVLDCAVKYPDTAPETLDRLAEGYLNEARNIFRALPEEEQEKYKQLPAAERIEFHLLIANTVDENELRSQLNQALLERDDMWHLKDSVSSELSAAQEEISRLVQERDYERNNKEAYYQENLALQKRVLELEKLLSDQNAYDNEVSDE